MNIFEFVNCISGGNADETLRQLYGATGMNILKQRARFISAAENFSRAFPECADIRVFSAPGRAEIGGNHTDHQHGCVLAVAVSADTLGIVSLNGKDTIRIISSGYQDIEISIDDLDVKSSEEGTSAALVRGVVSGFVSRGAEVGGFDAYITSDIVPGGGLSSSAAFEVLIGTIIDYCFNEGSVGAEETARIGSFAENVYFGKKSGLMDQTISATGGFVHIDFADPEQPEITPVDFDFSRIGYSLCMTDTKGSHSDLTGDYSAIFDDMKLVAECLDCEFLRDADEEAFYAQMPELMKKCTDRQLLRAAHFFNENRRVTLEMEALTSGDTEEFFRLVNESGDSSAMLLQNLYSDRTPYEQKLSLAIMLTKRFLDGNGAVRVHGGGFAGSVIAFVPNYLAGEYESEMERIFGANCCCVLAVRKSGACEIKLC